MSIQHYDIVIIGTGAGGGTLVHSLANTAAEILVLERGDFVPQEPENRDPTAVWRDLRYRTTERWKDNTGQEFHPYTHYCVGGNTKFWGSVLFRLRKEDFNEVEHVDGVSPAWPISYETLEPYYQQAERLFEVHGEAGLDPTEAPREPFPHEPVPHEATIEHYLSRIKEQGLHPSPLPLGLTKPGNPAHCILCNTCNSFPCHRDAKSDADVCCIRPVVGQSNVTLWTRARAKTLITDGFGHRVKGVEVDHAGERRRVEASLVVVSCGAVNSAALLLRSGTGRRPEGLANSSGLVGRRYMAHLATMLAGFHPFRVNPTVFQKTVAINDFYLEGPDVPYPLGQIQSQGRTHGVMAQTAAPWMPRWFFEFWVARGVDWLAMTEDLPRTGNRVVVDGDDRIQLQYLANNVTAHERLVREVKRILRRLGLPITYAHSGKTQNTTHQCGTVCFGTDPKTSVLDTFCRAHDVENLFVVDASFFPSSAAVNPGLTIAAQALRVADHIKETELGAGKKPSANHRGSTVQCVHADSVVGRKAGFG
ncbi:MAG: dehydrogenase [Acidobacteria bacterium]|nr:dehydrogenase [Acidobacteriota bacterium]|tara:strand:- start:2345 stop:3949 length:1605 start_codon:yes stop_codon:yes gene_type:complete